jgi:hypothetical protein
MVVPDLDAPVPMLSIEGRNFGPNPSVFLGVEGGDLEELPVVASSGNHIEAQLTRTAPGTYLILVLGGTGGSSKE